MLIGRRLRKQWFAGFEFTQHRIDERSGGTLAGALNQFDTLVNCSARGNAAEPTQLVNRQAQCSEYFKIEFGKRLRGDSCDLYVKQRSPAQYAHHTMPRQIMIERG